MGENEGTYLELNMIPFQLIILNFDVDSELKCTIQLALYNTYTCFTYI